LEDFKEKGPFINVQIKFSCINVTSFPHFYTVGLPRNCLEMYICTETGVLMLSNKLDHFLADPEYICDE
jgi:hypothetical protein